ncbi:MAG TPA: class I SAM-dependent methyltransferase, partial [Pyrinomonadaceae bacterium]|nr:class I SAM-dependent methyltransferase [Pyrinomonadaceae bacterium]
ELFEASYPAEHFDVVIASEIIEHVPDPEALVIEIRRVLRPGGMLWATTPNRSGISYRLLGDQWTAVCPPEHLQLFSIAGMESLLKAAGFKDVNVQVEGTNPYELLQKLRKRPQTKTNSAKMTGTDRVETGYALNEQLMKSPVRRALKRFVNGALRTARLGDYMKIYAVK